MNLGNAFGNIPNAFRLVWAASPLMTLVMVGITLLEGLVPPAMVWMSKLIVDRSVELFELGFDMRSGLIALLPLFAIEFVLLLLEVVGILARSLTNHIFNSKLNLHINSLIIRQALTLDLSYFEQAEFYDRLQNARQEADWRALHIVTESFSVLRHVITLTSFALLLIRFSPWLAVILFGATVPSFIVQGKYGHLRFNVLSGHASERRQMSYLEHLLTVDQFVKEIKLFKVGKSLLERYTNLFWKLFREDLAVAKARTWASVGWAIVGLLSYYFSYAWIILSMVIGLITFGDALMYILIYQRTRDGFQHLFGALTQLYEHSLFISNLFTYLELEPQMVALSKPHPMPTEIQQGIEFCNVSFRYPGKTEWALRDINLSLRRGEKMALVGTNGAGKTTLIKLLTRLYDPTEGQILLDGIDLRDYELDEWQEKIGVIFQNFVRYQFTASENIGLGQVEAINDQARILEAARKGGADEILGALPQGYETTLGTWFENGRELSGGQWQKVALSRAFMRDADILILDEPTSALDAEQEYQIFQRFRELTEGKLAILISHRFSTVRMADRIAVIKNGTIAELGSHDELIAQNEIYAHLFNIQAQGYR